MPPHTVKSNTIFLLCPFLRNVHSLSQRSLYALHLLSCTFSWVLQSPQCPGAWHMSSKDEIWKKKKGLFENIISLFCGTGCVSQWKIPNSGLSLWLMSGSVNRNHQRPQFSSVLWTQKTQKFIPGKALGVGSHMGFHVLEDEPHQTLQKIQK